MVNKYPLSPQLARPSIEECKSSEKAKIRSEKR